MAEDSAGHVSMPMVVAVIGVLIGLGGITLNFSRDNEARTVREFERINKDIAELKSNDKSKVDILVHNEFKSQIERQIIRNTNVIDDLTLKKDIFLRSLEDQRVRDELVQKQHDKDIDMLRNRITTLRQHFDDVDKHLRDYPK